MMRTTFQSLNRHTQSVLQERFTELASLQQKMVDQSAISRPSDGPIETANILRLETQNSQLGQYLYNMNDGLSWLSATDIAMSSMKDIMDHAAKDLAIQGDTDSLDPLTRQKLVNELEEQIMQMVSLVNSPHKGAYLFSGSEINYPAVDVRESKSTQDAKNNFEMCFFDGTATKATPSVPLHAGNNPTPEFHPDNIESFQIYDPNGGDNGLNDTKVGKIVPGSLTIVVDGDMMQENTDYKIDYMTGKLTVIDADNKYYPNIEKNGDFKPYHPMIRDFSPDDPNYETNFKVNLTYLDNSKDIYGDDVNNARMDSRMYRKIEEGVNLPINTTMNDLKVDAQTDIFSSLINLGQSLINSDREGVVKAMGQIEKVSEKIVSAQAVNGSVVNRFNNTYERTKDNQVRVEDLKSSIQEVDLTSVIADFAVLQTVFQAALNSTSRIMQTSLADYLR